MQEETIINEEILEEEMVVEESKRRFRLKNYKFLLGLLIVTQLAAIYSYCHDPFYMEHNVEVLIDQGFTLFRLQSFPAMYLVFYLGIYLFVDEKNRKMSFYFLSFLVGSLVGLALMGIYNGELNGYNLDLFSNFHDVVFVAFCFMMVKSSSSQFFQYGNCALVAMTSVFLAFLVLSGSSISVMNMWVETISPLFHLAAYALLFRAVLDEPDVVVKEGQEGDGLDEAEDEEIPLWKRLLVMFVLLFVVNFAFYFLKLDMGYEIDFESLAKYAVIASFSEMGIIYLLSLGLKRLLENTVGNTFYVSIVTSTLIWKVASLFLMMLIGRNVIII